MHVTMEGTETRTQRADVERVTLATSHSASLCIHCVGKRREFMQQLSGYCIKGQRCDGCRRVARLALTATSIHEVQS